MLRVGKEVWVMGKYSRVVISGLKVPRVLPVGVCCAISLSSPFTPTMPTELPYAADAEVSLSYDELEVCV